MKQVLVKPIITERSMALAAAGKYSFFVQRDANKQAIKQAIENTFNVNVIMILTSRIKGRTKRIGLRRTEITESPMKKAVVTVKPGQKISLFELSE